ncbi:DUF3617 domain-containing protein [Cellvibrio sp. NN19]|uniref:DUF3617 domain-containing protein n=1 Tax=Cellvibrio chitinivorans TaxID=3102792 RepID=UPI002B408B7A|nr:DUF3617 domain-containing protein [Cellvibrio sp. NN19]
MKALLSIVVVAISVSALSAQADPVKVDMKAGLWENTMTWDADTAKDMQVMQADQMKAAMEQMKEQFANMPPEQRKQMEEMMAQAGVNVNDDGVSLNNDQVQISSSGTTAKSCITQAEIDRGELPDDMEDCTSTLKQISATRFKSTYVCSGEEQSLGESEVNFHSPKHYSGTGKMVQTINGKKHTMNFKMEGKWLGSDCGDVKPAE